MFDIKLIFVNLDLKPLRELHRKKKNYTKNVLKNSAFPPVHVLGAKQPYKKLNQKRRAISITEVKLYIYINRINLLVFQNIFPYFEWK